MAQQIINVGAVPNDGDGDPIRTAFQKTNSNFTELYDRAQTYPPTSLQGAAGDEAGMYASDSTYFYYCFADYDGSSTIWAQVTQVGTISSSQINSGNSNVTITGAGGNIAMGINGVPNVAVFTTTSANIVGNISAGGFFQGNGSLLTGLYANANVVAYLPSYSGYVGNFAFTGNAFQNPNGASVENGSPVNGWTARLDIPDNGNTTPLQLQNTYGNIGLGAGAGAVITKTWLFDNTGTTTMPGNVSAAGKIVGGNLQLSTGGIRLSDTATESSIGIRANGGIGYAGISIPNNATANTVDLSIDNSQGNVKIQSAGLDGWLFGADNVLTAPGDISAAGNVTANNTLSFGNVTVLGGDPLSATDTTIAYKIPVTINGNVYYMALTAAQ